MAMKNHAMLMGIRCNLRRGRRVISNCLKKTETLVRHQNPEDEAKDGTFAAAALTQNDEALLGPDFQ